MPRRRQSKFGATIKATPFKDIRRQAALKPSLARAEQREKAKEDADCNMYLFVYNNMEYMNIFFSKLFPSEIYM